MCQDETVSGTNGKLTKHTKPERSDDLPADIGTDTVNHCDQNDQQQDQTTQITKVVEINVLLDIQADPSCTDNGEDGGITDTELELAQGIGQN